MRRIPRVRRPSGLSVSSSASPSLIAPFVAPISASLSISAPSQPPSTRKPVRSAPLLARFYSLDKQPLPQTLSSEPHHGTDIAPEQPVQFDEAGDWEHLPDHPPSQHQAYVPPPPRSHAERAEEVSDAEYVPATTADGLESVGGLKNWWERRAHWSKSSDFMGFKPRKKLVDPVVIEASLRRAVAETFALRQAGREDDLVGVWPVGGQEHLQRLMELDFQATDSGTVSLTGDVGGLLEGLQWTDEVQVVREQTAAEEPASPTTAPSKPVLSAEEARKYREAWHHSWKTISLTDPRVKFAVTKRVFQLTGQLIPDHKLPSITNVQSLLHTLQKPPKPKTLTEDIQKRQQDLLQLPNVSVATKRVKRGDKEKALGRYKLIEEELRRRDLPVEGHGFARKNQEMARLRGGL